jgi:sortase A
MRKDRRVRAVVRFFGAVAIVSGVLLIAEAAVTLAWQEPVSAFLADRAQAGLEDDLVALDDAATEVRSGVEERAPRVPDREILPTVAAVMQSRAEEGDAIGEIRIPAIGSGFSLVEGAGTGPLRKGPGHYADTPFPGRGGTTAVAGHRTTYGAPFRDVDQLQPGATIEVEMSYATLRYTVEKTEIVEPDAVWVKEPVGEERLVLTACHPPFSAAKRIVVFAGLESFELT